MLIASVLLAALVPQAPPAEEATPAVTVARAQESGDLAGFQTDAEVPEVEAPEVPEATEPTAMETPPVPPAETPEPPAMQATPVPPAETPAPMPAALSVASIQQDIDAGLKAFIRGRFSAARDAFQKAYDADPDSAAAAFYLGYACYKIGEPSARMNADKEKARDLFAKAYSLDPAFEPVWGHKAPPESK